MFFTNMLMPEEAAFFYISREKCGLAKSMLEVGTITRRNLNSGLSPAQ